MTDDLMIEVRRLNTIGDPLIYRILLARMIALHGRDCVRRALIYAAAGMGAISIAAAARWCQKHAVPFRKIG